MWWGELVAYRTDTIVTDNQHNLNQHNTVRFTQLYAEFSHKSRRHMSQCTIAGDANTAPETIASRLVYMFIILQNNVTVTRLHSVATPGKTSPMTPDRRSILVRGSLLLQALHV